MNYKLVQTITEDDLILSGLYSEGSKSKEAIIYIHGFVTDFYTHKFSKVLAESVNANGNAVVLAQNRGTGMRTEFLKSDRKDSVEIGAYYEKLEEAYLDISAWIEFLQTQGYEKFVLAGHSLGTIKSVRYLFEGKYKDLIEKLVLLAPFDKNGYVENKTKGQWHNHIKVAEQKIKDGKELELVTDEMEDYYMTYRTYYSWYIEEDLNLIWDFYRPEYISPSLKQIDIPVKVLVGSKDDFFYTQELGGSAEVTTAYLKNNINDVEVKLVEGGDHCYRGFEKEVSNEVLKFIT